MLIYIDSVINF